MTFFWLKIQKLGKIQEFKQIVEETAKNQSDDQSNSHMFNSYVQSTLQVSCSARTRAWEKISKHI